MAAASSLPSHRLIPEGLERTRAAHTHEESHAAPSTPFPSSEADVPQLHADILAIGRRLFAGARRHAPGPLSPERWKELMMHRFIGNEAVKLASLRFVDVFPALRTSRAVAAHIQEYFGEQIALTSAHGDLVPHLLRLGARVAAWPTPFPQAAALAARLGVRAMAGQFIAGTTVRQTARVMRRLEAQGFCFSLDLLGEAVISEPEASAFLKRYIEVLENLDRLMGRPTRKPATSTGPRINVSIKLTALVAHFNPIDPVHTSQAVRQRLRPLFRLARQKGAFINVDMEKHDYRNLTFRIVRDILMEDEFRDWQDVGIVHQAYLRDADTQLARWIEFLKQRGHGMTIRLVKGAYWDSEQIWAGQRGWPIPVITHKPSTDAMYERCTRMLLDAHPIARTAIASHNIRSIAHAIAYARANGVPAERLEFQMLHGMAGPIRLALLDEGVPVRIYAPCGDMISGIAYLVRRLLENTSQDSFLAQKAMHRVPEEQLLAAPRG